MGRRGPRPSPREILRMHGSWRANLNRNQPEPPRGHLRCPRWIDKEAKLMWHSVVPLLTAGQMLTKVDAPALTRYCQAWSRWKKAEEFLQKYGETYPLKDDQGRLRCFMPHPQVAIAHKLSNTLTRLEQEFGLTPATRRWMVPVNGRPTGGGRQPGDKFADFLFGRGAYARKDPPRPIPLAPVEPQRA